MSNITNEQAAITVLKRIYSCYINNKKKYSEAKSRQRALSRGCLQQICDVIGEPMPILKGPSTLINSHLDQNDLGDVH